MGRPGPEAGPVLSRRAGGRLAMAAVAAAVVAAVAPVTGRPRPVGGARAQADPDQGRDGRDGGPTAAPGPPVALTFDAGADRGHAESILDLLAADGVPASFGVTGLWAQANPTLVTRMGAEGHLLLNHTFSHRSFTGFSDRRGGLPAAARRAELEAADAVLAALLGRSTRPWYRLPYGDADSRVAADVAPSGYTRQAGWTVDSLGWRGGPVPEIVARCLRLAAPGAIYLFHVGSASRDGPALGAVLAGLRQRGFGFVTLEGLAPA